MQRLISYFADGISSRTLQTIGAEIETQFVDKNGRAIQTQVSQQMLGWLAENGWKVDCRKSNLITALVDQNGNKIFYELGRHNMEVSTTASTLKYVLGVTNDCLAQLYDAARRFGAEPYFAPILDGTTEAVIGVRSTDRHSDWFIYYFGLLGNGAITLLTNVLYGNNAGEYEGCYKAFSTRLVRTIEVKTDDFDFDNELVCKLLKRGVRIVDVPIRYYPRNYAEGKKITWRHGFLILWTVLKYRFID